MFMVGFAIFSVLLSYFLLEYAPDPLDKIVRALAVGGIVIHELTHVLMCLITNTRIDSVNLLQRNKSQDEKSKLNHHGRVVIGDFSQLSFLQAVLIGLAPLYISFWLFFFLWDQIKSTNIDVTLFFIYLFLMVSIALNAAPSLADFGAIPKAFGNDPSYSFYQMFLLFLSAISVWFITTQYQLTQYHEIVTYFFIFLTYFACKYSLRGINSLYHRFFNKNHPRTKLQYRRFTRRRRFKTMKPKKIGVKEAQW